MNPNAPIETPVQVPLADLFNRFLMEQQDAHAAGFLAHDTAGEVLPHEVGPLQPVDPRLAWEGAVAVLSVFHPKLNSQPLQRPEEWATLVALHELAAGLAFAVGNFPQLVRNVLPLMQATDLTALRPARSQPLHAPTLLNWAARIDPAQSFAQRLLALGALRLARQFEAAAKLLGELQANVPADWQPALANEEAALAWHAGRADEALQLWRKQPDSVPVLFNRGMAELFNGRPATARTALTQAVNQLPEDGAWHHLGRLYLALVETRAE